MIETLKQRSKDPSVNPYLRLMDMDNTSPKIFYMMDEIGRTQILRKYDWHGTLPQYCGTYEIVHKTEKQKRFCLIMRRIANEMTVAPHHMPLSDEEMRSFIVVEYYPGTQGRVFTRALSEDLMTQVVNEYIAKENRRNKIRRLMAPRKSNY